MSDNQPFDDYVRQRLGQYSPEVPPHIWQQIATRNEDKKPRGFWVLRNNRIGLLAVGLLLLGGMATYWATRKAPNSFDGVPKAVATNSAAANPAAPAAPSNSAAANEPANPAAQNGASTGTVAANDLSASPTVDVPTVKKPLATQQGMVDAAPNDGNAGVAVPEAVAPADKKGLRFGPSPTNRFIKTRLGQTGQPFKKMAATATANTDGAAASPESGSGGEAVQGQQPLGGLFSKPYGPAQRLYSSKAAPGSLQTRGLTGLTVPDCPSIEDDAAGNKKYFEAYAGPDLGLSSFGSFQNDSSSNRYLQKRKETLRFTSAFSMGLRYTRVFKNGMSIRSGINYSQINERFRYVNERVIRYILVITPRDINVGGNIVTVFDTLRYTQNGTRIKTTYNRYRQIDIPLQLGYEFGNGRLHTNVSAGAIINLYSWQRGDMLDSTLRPVSITTGKGSSSYGFKTNMGVGFLGSVSVYYKLTTRLHALAEPYFRYNLQPMTRDNQNVTQKYSTLGVRLGLRWDLK